MNQPIIGSVFYHTASCDNSMQWAKENLASAPNGAVFIAETLTAARGRQGRTWEYTPGQITVTILLKPTLIKSLEYQDIALQLNHLSMALSLGIVTPLNNYEVGLKWPNDFYLADKKIGGMLVEIVWQNEQPIAVILGFAINVNNHFTREHSLAKIATSLYDRTKTTIDESELLAKLLTSLDVWYQTWLTKSYTLIFESWKQQQLFLGKKINVHYHNGSKISGILKDLAPNGDALLDHNGTSTTISFYEIFSIST